MKKLVAVSEAKITCPYATENHSGMVIGTTNENDKADGKSILAESDNIVGTHIESFNSKCKLRPKNPWHSDHFDCFLFKVSWENTAKNENNIAEKILTEDSYFRCEITKTKVHISDPGQYSVFVKANGDRPPTDASFYYVTRDGEMHFVDGAGKVHMFYIQLPNGDFELSYTLTENAAGLVKFPVDNVFQKFGPLDRDGDRFLKPKAAAALIGLMNEAREKGINFISLNDMSDENGYDPPTHSGHGHSVIYGSPDDNKDGDTDGKKRSGLDIDFAFIDVNGNAHVSNNVSLKIGNLNDPNNNFSTDLNKLFYTLAYKYGFTKNYITASNAFINGIPGLTHESKHEDHGHLGFDPDHAQQIP